MHRAVRPGATTVLYVGGTSRSGSTLLERLLGELDRVAILGEVGHLWERGIRNDERCACGEPFSSCPFWTAVGDKAFNGWPNVDVDLVLRLKNRVDRQRWMPLTAARRPMTRIQEDAVQYSDFYRRIYDAAKEIAGADVVVDSTKVPPQALALSHDPNIDLRVMHITRDSRGVAYSWSKSVARPETDGAALMPQLSALSSTAYWTAHNTAIQSLRYRKVPVERFRYEDLVLDPGPVVGKAWRELDLPGSGLLPLIDRVTVELRTCHSVAGNPMRFRAGPTTLKADVEWKVKMRSRDRMVVTAASFPTLVWLGYVGRRSR